MDVFQKFAGISVESQTDGTFRVTLPHQSVKVLASIQHVRDYLGNLPVTEIQNLVYVPVTFIRDMNEGKVIANGYARAALLQCTQPMLTALKDAVFSFTVTYSHLGETHTAEFKDVELVDGMFENLETTIPILAEINTAAILGMLTLHNQAISAIQCPVSLAVTTITPPEETSPEEGDEYVEFEEQASEGNEENEEPEQE